VTNVAKPLSLFGWEGAISRMIRKSEYLPVIFAEINFFGVKEVRRWYLSFKSPFLLYTRKWAFLF